MSEDITPSVDPLDEMRTIRSIDQVGTVLHKLKNMALDAAPCYRCATKNATTRLMTTKGEDSEPPVLVYQILLCDECMKDPRVAMMLLRKGTE